MSDLRDTDVPTNIASPSHPHTFRDTCHIEPQRHQTCPFPASVPMDHLHPVARWKLSHREAALGRCTDLPRLFPPSHFPRCVRPPGFLSCCLRQCCIRPCMRDLPRDPGAHDMQAISQAIHPCDGVQEFRYWLTGGKCECNELVCVCVHVPVAWHVPFLASLGHVRRTLGWFSFGLVHGWASRCGWGPCLAGLGRCGCPRASLPGAALLASSPCHTTRCHPHS